MTSVVIVKAHCADNKEIHVVVSKGEEVTETYVLQNGEAKEVLIYDDRTVTSYELLKDEAVK